MLSNDILADEVIGDAGEGEDVAGKRDDNGLKP